MDKTCYHCGEGVPVNTNYRVDILGESRDMCCPGCHAVAKMIVANNLESYYQFRQKKAERYDLIPDELQNLHRYDDEAIQEDFVLKNQNNNEVTLSIDGVSCAACAWLIEKHMVKQSGVCEVNVNTLTHRARLVWDPTKTKLSQLITQIHKLGYKVSPFEQDEQEQAYHQATRQYLYRIGIAGIASMQVMMVAVALYLEVFSDLDDAFKHYFRIVSLFFATPVMLYSAWPFYQSAWRSLKAKAPSMDVPVSIAMILAYVASIVATINQSGEVFYEAVTMFAFFLLLGRYFEMKARREATAHSANLLKLVPHFAHLEDGTQVAVKHLNVGDSVRVLPGDAIPADGLITSGASYLNEAMLTGEPIPITKGVGDHVYAGTVNGDEAFIMRVEKSKLNSMISNIVRIQNNAQINKPKIARIADQVSQYFVIATLVVGAGTWLFWHFYRPEDAFWIMLSVLVATCPCALALATPTAITCATSRLSHFGLLLRKGHIFETLCKVNHIIMDKTGTLTEGRVEITNTVIHDKAFDAELCLKIAASLEQHANHPIANAFRRFFDSLIQVNHVTNVIGSGIEGLWQGQQLRLGSAQYALNTQHNDIDLATTDCVYLSRNGQPLATFFYQDSIRKDSLDLITQLKKSGIKITLLSGDNLANVEQVAQQLGISQVVAQVSPEQKLEYVRNLPKSDITLMVGDGINDAPTLSGAHLSVAMGGGTDIAKASADMVLLNDKLINLLKARELAFKTRSVIKENLWLSFFYNILILPLAIMGYVPPYIASLGMSLSSVIVIANSMRLLKYHG
ncbi:cadmium-translocating P-type ATPase [Vibrio cholerae]|nr:cadmium-translocating P-type ATPase [Vibrio cholerae]EJL6503122.1 cadmium-translocating P-type ATPase [Vibrio cholerae]